MKVVVDQLEIEGRGGKRRLVVRIVFECGKNKRSGAGLRYCKATFLGASYIYAN